MGTKHVVSSFVALALAASACGTTIESDLDAGATTTAPVPQTTAAVDDTTQPGAAPDSLPLDDTTTTSSPDAAETTEPTTPPLPSIADGDPVFDDTAWLDHPAAPLVPEASFFGPQWVRTDVRVEDAQPPDEADRIEGCAIDPPAIPSQVAADYELDAGGDGWYSMSLISSTGDVDANTSFFTAFEAAVTECDLTDEFGVPTAVPVESSADKMLALDIEVADVEGGGHVLIGLYGDSMLGLYVIGVGEEANAYDAQDIASWLDELATR